MVRIKLLIAALIFLAAPLNSWTMGHPSCPLDSLFEVDGIWYGPYSGKDAGLRGTLMVCVPRNLEPENYYHGQINIPAHIERFGVLRDVTVIDQNAFSYTLDVDTVNLPSTIKRIGKRAFYNSRIKSVELYSCPVDSIMADAFNYCKYLSAIDLPDSIRFLGDNCFQSSGLTTFNQPKLLNQLSSNLLADCRNLKQIILHDGLGEVHNQALRCNLSLKEFTLPGTVTLVTGAIFGYPNWYTLKHVTLNAVDDPQRTVFEKGAFLTIDSLETFVSLSELPPLIDDMAFSRVNTYQAEPLTPEDVYTYQRCVLKVPAQSVEAYKQAQGWRNFKHIEAIAGHVDIETDDVSKIIETQFFDLAGRRVTAPRHGQFYIIKQTLDNGAVRVQRKVI